MNTTMQGHNHGGKNHALGMLGIGALVLVVLVLSGKSVAQALPFAALLACPLLMLGMMVMMGRGNGRQSGGDPTIHADHDARPEWQDPAITTSAQPQDSPRS
jgi:hypothetical protein